jgi:hypothetical protein
MIQVIVLKEYAHMKLHGSIHQISMDCFIITLNVLIVVFVIVVLVNANASMDMKVKDVKELLVQMTALVMVHANTLRIWNLINHGMI